MIITEIDDLVALTPGSFTQSFFGVAGSLDVRGTPGETYFRGIKRIDNPGNYPTPIGASDRIDVVRGPGLADLRSVEDRWLPEFRAQVGACE